jgi:hypothetical protein
MTSRRLWNGCRTWGPGLAAVLLVACGQDLEQAQEPETTGRTETALTEDKQAGFVLNLPWADGAEFRIGNGYGSGKHQNSDFHSLDFMLSVGTPVYAAAPGRVTYAGLTPAGGWQTYGNVVFIEHQNGYQTHYAHLDTVLVTAGQLVDSSTQIATSGQSGGTTPHLHFTVYRNATMPSSGQGPYGGTAIKPEPFAGCTKNATATCTGLVLNAVLKKDRPAPALVRNPNGSVELFARGHANGLWHCNLVWNGGSPTCSGGWVPLGGVLTTGPTADWDGSTNQPSVFALGLREEIWNATRSSTGTWSWTQLSGKARGRPAGVYNSVERRMEVFIRGTDEALNRAARGSAGWGAWQRLGGNVMGVPLAVRDGSGRPRAFAVGVDYSLYTIRPDASGTWVPEQWWPANGQQVGTAAVVLDGANRLNVFARGLTHALTYTQHTPPDGWPASFQNLTGTLTNQPAAALNTNGRLSAFVRGLSNELYEYNLTGHTYLALGTPGGALTSDAAVSPFHDGRLIVFVWQSNSLRFKYQTAPGSTQWSGWLTLGLPAGF